MNSLLDDDDEEQDRNQRELTLSTGTILGIFFGLILLCGLFFGFGYKMGSHKPMQPGQAVTVENAPSPAADFGGFKPAAGSPAGGGTSTAASRGASEMGSGTAERSSKADRSTAVASENPVTAARSAATVPAASEPVAGGGFIVQVAAVSHQQDAELLVNALRSKGYPVSAHTEPQDKFFHIQVGPYATHKDADIAKQRLVADGYQPIVK